MRQKRSPPPRKPYQKPHEGPGAHRRDFERFAEPVDIYAGSDKVELGVNARKEAHSSPAHPRDLKASGGRQPGQGGCLGAVQADAARPRHAALQSPTRGGFKGAELGLQAEATSEASLLQSGSHIRRGTERTDRPRRPVQRRRIRTKPSADHAQAHLRSATHRWKRADVEHRSQPQVERPRRFIRLWRGFGLGLRLGGRGPRRIGPRLRKARWHGLGLGRRPNLLHSQWVQRDRDDEPRRRRQLITRIGGQLPIDSAIGEPNRDVQTPARRCRNDLAANEDLVERVPKILPSQIARDRCLYGLTLGTVRRSGPDHLERLARPSERERERQAQHEA